VATVALCIIAVATVRHNGWNLPPWRTVVGGRGPTATPCSQPTIGSRSTAVGHNG
jgi:hypothetical protein